MKRLMFNMGKLLMMCRKNKKVLVFMSQSTYLCVL